MESQDIILEGIHKLGELQDKKEEILGKISTTREQSREIESNMQYLPSYIDKCEYFKKISHKFLNRASDSVGIAHDIIESVSKMKNYIDPQNEKGILDSCRNSQTIKQKILRDLQEIQSNAYIIMRPDTQGDYEQYSTIEQPIIVREGGKKTKNRRVKNKQKNKRFKRTIKRYLKKY